MKELTAKKYLESKGLNEHDYMDGGMINHISEMMEEYHQAKLHLLNIPVVVKSFVCDCEEKGGNRCETQCLGCDGFQRNE